MAIAIPPIVIGAEELIVGLLIAMGILANSRAVPKVEPRVLEKCKTPEHRGRIQAQGGGLEQSQSWAQTFPPPKAQGFAQLDDVFYGLSPTDQTIRLIPYNQIQARIASGPISAQYIQSFYAPANLQSKRGDLRMDLEVRKGIAFV